MNASSLSFQTYFPQLHMLSTPERQAQTGRGGLNPIKMVPKQEIKLAPKKGI
jgi:hypothetical protein